MAQLLNGATAVSTGAAQYTKQQRQTTVSATVAGTGAVSATVQVEVSNTGAKWVVLGTITLSGTTEATDGFGVDVRWPYTRAKVTAISGTGAAVTCHVEG